MAGFKAHEVVEALTYDFGGIDGRPDLASIRGVVPEPSDQQVRKMNAALRDAIKSVTGTGDFDPTDRVAAARIFGKLTDEQLAAMEDANLAAIGIVTQDSPSVEQIQRLPFRYKREFIKWLVKELNDPESQATATNS